MKIMTAFIWLGAGFYFAKEGIETQEWWNFIISIMCFVMAGIGAILFDRQLKNR